MNIDVKRIPDIGIAGGGHVFSADEDDVFECPQQVAALRLTYTFTHDEMTDTDDGMRVTMFLTRDEAHEFATALVECVCDA